MSHSGRGLLPSLMRVLVMVWTVVALPVEVLVMVVRDLVILGLGFVRDSVNLVVDLVRDVVSVGADAGLLLLNGGKSALLGESK